MKTKYIRRTFTIRSDQDRALAISLAVGSNKHGRNKSEVIRLLLDEAGYRDNAYPIRDERKKKP